MIDLHTYELFLATAVVLVVSPGPDFVLVLSRTLADGPSAGLATLLGTQVGNVVHAMLAGLGVSTVVLLFPFLVDTLKVVGVAYLVHLALQAWRAPATLDVLPLSNGTGFRGRHFVQGLANNLANPKMIVFFLALFPQFVRAENGSIAIQSFVLGTTLAGMAITWMGLVVIAAGRFRSSLASNTVYLKFARRLASVTFFGLAYRLATGENR